MPKIFFLALMVNEKQADIVIVMVAMAMEEINICGNLKIFVDHPL